MPGIDIDVVSDGPDDSGAELSLSVLQSIRMALPGAIVARNVFHMVNQIGARLPAGSGSIHRMRIYGHGIAGQVWIGSGRNYPTDPEVLGVRDQGLMLNGADLRRIRGLFDRDGWVEVHGCNFAEGKRGAAALHGLSSIWSVRVMASSAAQWGGLSGNLAVTQLQPPVLTAVDITPGAVPETPISMNRVPQTPISLSPQ